MPGVSPKHSQIQAQGIQNARHILQVCGVATHQAADPHVFHTFHTRDGAQARHMVQQAVAAAHPAW